MKPAVVFLEQQSWLGGAQLVLEATLDSIGTQYECIVAFPDDGPFRSSLEDRGVETLDIPVGNYKPGRKSPLEMINFAWRSLYCGLKLTAFIRRKQVALVYINGPRCLPAGVLAAFLTRRPAIFHVHLLLKRKLEVILVRRLARQVSCVLACSEAAATPLLDHDRRLRAKTQILYNPLFRVNNRADHSSVGAVYDRPFSAFEYSRKNCFTVGIVGRITEQKGHHLLLGAMGKLPQELRAKIQVLIVGAEAPNCESDFRYRELLLSEITRQGLEEQVHWTGYQSDPSSCFASMDVLVHPSTDEALGIVVLEALAWGVPVIAARSGGIPEVVRDGLNGLLVPAEDEKALSEALALFFQSDIREHLQQGAASGIDSRFSMDTFSAGIRTAIGRMCPLTEA